MPALSNQRVQMPTLNVYGGEINKLIDWRALALCTRDGEKQSAVFSLIFMVQAGMLYVVCYHSQKCKD